MLKVVEAFSGIGSQAKALENLNIKHEILHTVDWDVNAIIAYDLIHNGKQDLTEYDKYSKQELIDILSKYTLSFDGKKPCDIKRLRGTSVKFLQSLYCAIERSKNLVSITDIKGEDLPNDIDLFTYSFPCQDLSVAGYWHGNKGGIARDAHNRSGMLWEVERILYERYNSGLELPKMLLMENVSNILSKTNIENFNDWRQSLVDMGYYNEVFTLNASNFGMPQKRVRTYMLSVLCSTEEQYNKVEEYFKKYNLQTKWVLKKHKKLEKIIKNDYNNVIYKQEADECQASKTPSREDIYRDNLKILDQNTSKVLDVIVPTVTTKQDRHPNSGVIDYFCGDPTKSQYRFLTPRECFLLMGFEEKDFEVLLDNQIYFEDGRKFFTRDKLYKLAGNSIVVNVLEEIFKQVEYIHDNILVEGATENQGLFSLKEKLEGIKQLSFESLQSAID